MRAFDVVLAPNKMHYAVYADGTYEPLYKELPRDELEATPEYSSIVQVDDGAVIPLSELIAQGYTPYGNFYTKAGKRSVRPYEFIDPANSVMLNILMGAFITGVTAGIGSSIAAGAGSAAAAESGAVAVTTGSGFDAAMLAAEGLAFDAAPVAVSSGVDYAAALEAASTVSVDAAPVANTGGFTFGDITANIPQGVQKAVVGAGTSYLTKVGQGLLMDEPDPISPRPRQVAETPRMLDTEKVALSLVGLALASKFI